MRALRQPVNQLTLLSVETVQCPGERLRRECSAFTFRTEQITTASLIAALTTDR